MAEAEEEVVKSEKNSELVEDSVIKTEVSCDEPSSSENKINITIKTVKDRQVFETDSDISVKDFKCLVAEKFSVEVDQLCLIFSGKIMNDDESSFKKLNIKEGSTIHLVIRAAPKPSEPQPARPEADIRATPFTLGNIGGLPGLQNLGLGSSSFMDIQNRMQSELLGNPNLLRQVLENPLVQTFFNNPGNIRSLMVRNPEMQGLIERNPEIGQMLDNPELLRQTMELARNPSMLQELMRSQDRVFGNNEIISNEFGTSQHGYHGVTEQPSGSAVRQENTSNLQGAANQNSEQQPLTPGPGVFSNPQMSSLILQMASNSDFVQNMISAPYTQTMLEALSENPDLANNLITENPFLSDLPFSRECLREIMPQMANQLRNPEVHNLITNPQALDAVLQIQQGMETLRQTAPNFLSTFPVSLPNTSGETATNASSEQGTENSSTGNQNESRTNPEMNPFSEYMSRMMTGLITQNNSSLPSEQRYQVQLAQLQAMGFTNREANLEALVSSFGDINVAIQKLILNQAN